MSEPKCANCFMRAKYDRDPKSILSRLWRWHINWCPGWKSYMKSLSPAQKGEITAKYKL